MIERFGLEAMTGRRQFYFGELRRLIHAENIQFAFQSRARHGNWVTWEKENPELRKMLIEAELLCQQPNPS
jgi:hypothetical protein